MSVEDDHEGELPPGAEHYPAQLLFLHMGQTDIKELRWAPPTPATQRPCFDSIEGGRRSASGGRAT